jgi:hypothetical protein
MMAIAFAHVEIVHAAHDSSAVGFRDQQAYSCGPLGCHCEERRGRSPLQPRRSQSGVPAPARYLSLESNKLSNLLGGSTCHG